MPKAPRDPPSKARLPIALVGAAAAALVLIPFFHLGHPAHIEHGDHPALSALEECEACKWASSNPVVLPSRDRTPVAREVWAASAQPAPADLRASHFTSDGHPPRAPPASALA